MRMLLDIFIAKHLVTLQLIMEFKNNTQYGVRARFVTKFSYYFMVNFLEILFLIPEKNVTIFLRRYIITLLL